MRHLGLLFTLTILGVHFWGLMLAAGLYWRNRWFALAAGPILAVTAIYAIECHFGLGPNLTLLGLGSTVASLGLIALSLTAWEPHGLGAKPRQVLAAWRAEFALRNLPG